MMNEFLDQLELEGKAKKTVETYYFRLLKFRAFLEEHGHDELEITVAQMADFRNELLREGCSHRYINAILSVVRGYYDFLIVNEKRDQFNPVLSALRSKAVYPRPAVLSDEQLKAFESWVAGLQMNLQVGFMLMLHAGLRVSEAASIKKSDVTLENGAVYVKISDAKWGSDRKVPIMDASSASRIWEFVSGLDISSKPIVRASSRTFQKYCEMFCAMASCHMSCHTLRHTFATRLLESGIPMEKIRLLLGHKNINMTAHYTQNARISFNSIAPTIFQG